MIDAENTTPKAATEHVNHHTEATAFSDDDIHGYIELGRRLAITGIFGLVVIVCSLGIWLLFKVVPA